MTPIPLRKLFSTPALLGVFFLLFLVAASQVLLRPAGVSPVLVTAVVGMAIVGVLAIKQLTVRARETEQALVEGERYIEAVAELSHDIHAIIETNTRAFLYLNPAVESLLGYSQETFLKGGLDFFHSLVHPEDLVVLRKQYVELLQPLERPLGPDESEAIQEQNFRIRNNHGDYRWFRSRRNVFVRFPDGRPAEFLAVVQDITEQRRYEAALVQAQKVETLGALTRGTVHDLNNTLMGIQGFADIALGASADPGVLRSNLENVQVSIKRASALCREMLTHLGHGRIQIAQRALNDAVRESLPAIESLVPQGGVLVLELENNLPLASVDLNQARYALLNLVFNAVASVGIGGGEIAIRTFTTRLSGQEAGASGLTGDYVCLEVRDSGPGKPLEVLEQIFDPLFSTLHPGHGLGLSAVQGILKEHQGGLQIVKTPGAGNTTRLFFPLAEKSPEIDEGDEGTPLVGLSGVILVIDDEPSIRAILRQGLEFAGYKVIEAEDGVDGFGAFVRHRSSISAVLLDLTMPRMGGEEVFEEIHKLAPEVPVILMSGYTEEDATASLPNHRLAGFLSKPCSIKDALAVVQKALDGSTAMTPR